MIDDSFLEKIFSFISPTFGTCKKDTISDKCAFVVKDVIDLEKIPTSGSNPTWLKTHDTPQKTATALQFLLDSGAQFVGKTHSDELGLSMFGKNMHYGTPLNPASPQCFPGGSSSGAAAAVGLGFADFALAADTGGSIRAPASMCGILGYRPTHGLIPTCGSIPIAPTLDTLGIMAKKSEILQKYGEVLLRGNSQNTMLSGNIVIATDLYQQNSELLSVFFEEGLHKIAHHFKEIKHLNLYENEQSSWLSTMFTIVLYECWESHGAWVTAKQPKFGDIITNTLKAASEVTLKGYNLALKNRNNIKAKLERLLHQGDILVIPTLHDVAPLLTATNQMLNEYGISASVHTCISSLGGLPEVTFPFIRYEGKYLGLSLIGPAYSDRELLKYVAKLYQ
jgi:amidase